MWRGDEGGHEAEKRMWGWGGIWTETETSGSRPNSMRMQGKKKRERWKEPVPQIVRFCRISARSDNGLPDNGTGRNEAAFHYSHCPL